MTGRNMNKKKRLFILWEEVKDDGGMKSHFLPVQLHKAAEINMRPKLQPDSLQGQAELKAHATVY